MKIEIIAYDKNQNSFIDLWKNQCKEANQELYNFDSIFIDFKGKYVDFIDRRYSTEEKWRGNTTIAPIRVPFDELDSINIFIKQ